MQIKNGVGGTDYQLKLINRINKKKGNLHVLISKVEGRCRMKNDGYNFVSLLIFKKKKIIVCF